MWDGYPEEDSDYRSVDIVSVCDGYPEEDSDHRSVDIVSLHMINLHIKSSSYLHPLHTSLNYYYAGATDRLYTEIYNKFITGIFVNKLYILVFILLFIYNMKKVYLNY